MKTFHKFISLLLALGVLTSCSSGSNSNSPIQGDSGEEERVDVSFLGTKDELTKSEDLKTFNSLTVERDEFTSETYWNLPKRLEQAPNLKDELTFKFYICQFGTCPEDSPELGLFLMYVAQDWLFMESAIFKIGEETLELFPEEKDKVRETMDAGYIFEVMVFGLKDDQIEFFSKVYENEEVRVRVYGSGAKSEETKFNPIEVEGLKTMLSAYRHIRNEKISGGNS